MHTQKHTPRNARRWQAEIALRPPNTVNWTKPRCSGTTQLNLVGSWMRSMLTLQYLMDCDCVLLFPLTISLIRRYITYGTWIAARCWMCDRTYVSDCRAEERMREILYGQFMMENLPDVEFGWTRCGRNESAMKAFNPFFWLALLMVWCVSQLMTGVVCMVAVSTQTEQTSELICHHRSHSLL